MQASRITIFAGHYGSGKTTLAVSYALWLRRQQGLDVTLCDLDIVNPYFRTADARQLLADSGVLLISSPFANTNVDAPALPAQTRAIFDDRSRHAVIDLGGDDRGALALGRYAALIREEADHEMLLVVNPFRPLTRNIEDLLAIQDEIETASRVRFTGIVNNANLGNQTTLSEILRTLDFAEAISYELSLPLKMTAIAESLLEDPEDPDLSAIAQRSEIFPVSIFSKSDWMM